MSSSREARIPTMPPPAFGTRPEGQPPAELKGKSVAAPEQRPESAAETTSPAQRFFEKALLGDGPGKGILRAIETAAHVTDLEALEVPIEQLAFDAEALLLFGHPDAGEAGLRSLQNAQFAITTKKTELLGDKGYIEEPIHPLDQLDKARRALMLLARWREIHPHADAIIKPVRAMTTSAFLALRTENAGRDGRWKEQLMPHRMLKTRLLAFGMQHELIGSLSAEDRLLIKLESNDLADPLSLSRFGGWDSSYEPSATTDTTTFDSLRDRFNAICKRAELINNIKNADMHMTPNWMRMLVEHQNKWFELKLDMVGNVSSRL